MKPMLVFSLFVLILGAEQVASNDCCVADQFSASFAETSVHISTSEGQSSRARGKCDAAMDYTGHRYAYNYTWHNYGKDSSFNARYIYLYNEDTFYRILDDSQCFKTSLVGQEPFQCLPDKAFLEDTVYFGKNSLQLNSWKMNIDDQVFHGDLRFATTQENCIPVVFSMIARSKQSPREYDHFVFDGAVFNYTTGLGPSPFTVPDICNNATQKLKDDTRELFDKWNLLRRGMVFF